MHHTTYEIKYGNCYRYVIVNWIYNVNGWSASLCDLLSFIYTVIGQSYRLTHRHIDIHYKVMKISLWDIALIPPQGIL